MTHLDPVSDLEFHEAALADHSLASVLVAVLVNQGAHILDNKLLLDGGEIEVDRQREAEKKEERERRRIKLPFHFSLR